MGLRSIEEAFLLAWKPGSAKIFFSSPLSLNGFDLNTVHNVYSFEIEPNG